MSSRLNLTCLPEPVTSKRSGRLAAEDVATALAAPAKHFAGRHSIGNRTPIRQSSHPSGALAAGATASAGRLATHLAEAPPAIALDQLGAHDQIVIQTAHSTYIFLVIDPAKGLGLVVGGVFGDYAAEAYLEMVPVTHDRLLKVGGRVRLYVRSNVGSKRVTTSAITGLIHRRTETKSPSQIKL